MRPNPKSLVGPICRWSLVLPVVMIATVQADDSEGLALFESKIRPVLTEHCDRCHSALVRKPKGGLRLDSRDASRKGGHSGPAVVPNSPGESLLLEAIARTGDIEPMPPKTKLPESVVADFRRWIELGAPDPRDAPKDALAETWWSLRPIARPPVPEGGGWARTPIDAFVLEKLSPQGLTPSPEADRRTLIRRVTFDLIGLPPTPEEIQSFLDDPAPDAYEKVVDRLLASPHLGERWGRHWLDVARYGDTHGYDKDKPRPNAWPYRDYVIRAFNEDKPYGQFVREQVAGNVLYPGTRDGLEALGFISAGPWDFIGQAEVPETKIDGQIARLLDRDDMVSNTLNTFASLTVQCARCHDHKFDPVSQEDYYSLQAVFAALDKADRTYDPDPAVAIRRSELTARRAALDPVSNSLASLARKKAGEPLAEIDRQIEALTRKDGLEKSPSFGYHSNISPTPDAARWVQVDLGKPVEIARIVLHAPDDDFNGIGPGFGFPVRFKVEASDDPDFRTASMVADRTIEDFPNPWLNPVPFDFGKSARYVRITATQLKARQNDYNFALAEVEVFNEAGVNLAREARVSALDTIEAPPRWSSANLVDGLYPTTNVELAVLQGRRTILFREALCDPHVRDKADRIRREVSEIDKELARLPEPHRVYSGTIHSGTGAFRGTGPDGGKPRVIHVLKRGEVTMPGAIAEPGVPPVLEGVPDRFGLPPDAPEGDRRAALARWLTDPRHPLTWRSIVNRVWMYHFGRGLVESPSDFGRMGRTPSHPELLDWLAAEFRDGGQSLKQLHRMIVLSSTYRQSSAVDDNKATIDGDNTYLWRMNRRRLEAEEIRDSVLMVAGHLDRTPGGPGFQDFVVERPEHSPHYEYRLADPEDPKTHRRSIYRFIVRSQPQPFLTALDCADPSSGVDKRNESTTALQALALLNDRLMVSMAAHLAERLDQEPGDLGSKIDRAVLLALGRSPSDEERQILADHAGRFGLANACRLIFNLNEFVFVD
ncbi:DUF1553 domain-containing protein [Tundrisphaera lichenicola]|uniref:DUF1553 domain-containing protein n=1 Tax=Tundrisphaera lichenicola TaxID=2029860 RepID=UPI003EBE7E95